MAKIISVHSYRGGTGKSNTAANIAAMLAMVGKRVGVVDTDVQSPGIYVILGLGDVEIEYALNDYLNGECAIEETAVDVTANLQSGLSGEVFLIPSRSKAEDISRLLRGYDVSLLVDGYDALIDNLALDVLLIDTHPGLNNETFMSVSVSDILVIILRPDYQDYQGTAVVVDVSKRLGVEQMVLVANKIPRSLPLDMLKQQLEENYALPVGAMLPHSDEMMAFASQGVFVLAYPDHVIAEQIKQLTEMLMA